MGSNPVNFQIVSDQKECLRSIVSGRANYEDEFYSVSLLYRLSVSLVLDMLQNCLVCIILINAPPLNTEILFS